jgi:hypothetical protein
MFQPLPLHGDIRPWRFRRVSTPPQRSEVGMNDAVATQSEALELQSRQSVLATAPRALRHERIPSLRMRTITHSPNEIQRL